MAMRIFRSCSAAVLVVTATCPVLSAAAQSRPAAVDAGRLMDDAAQCRALSDPAERLACFDRTVAALAAARENGDITLLDRARVRATNRSLFGFTLPKLNLFGDRDGDPRAEGEVVREVESVIRDVAGAGPGLYVLRLADGSQWRLTETARFAPRAGETISIRRGALTSYRASIAKGRSLSIVRER